MTPKSVLQRMVEEILRPKEEDKNAQGTIGVKISGVLRLFKQKKTKKIPNNTNILLSVPKISQYVKRKMGAESCDIADASAQGTGKENKSFPLVRVSSIFL